MKSVNVAIVGCGIVAKGHLAAWTKVPSAKVVAICDTDENALRAASRAWMVSRCYTSMSELLEDKEVNLWDICTPPQFHASITIPAIKEGVNVLIEKPMTLTIKEAEKIVRAEKSASTKVGVIHNWLFEPPVSRARTLIEQERIGEIVSVGIEIPHTKNEAMTANRNHWCHKLPGGRFSEMMAHPIYLLRHFIGKISVETVVVSKFGEYPWMKSDELYATFKAGAKLGATYVSFNAPRDCIFIHIFGKEGILKVDVINATVNLLPPIKISRFNKATDSLKQAVQLSTSTLKNAASILSRRWMSGHEMCIHLFAESLIKDKDPPVTVEEGLEVVKVLEDTCRIIENVQKSRAQ